MSRIEELLEKDIEDLTDDEYEELENRAEELEKMTKIVSWGEIEAKAYEFTDGTGIQGKIPSPTENTFAKIKQNGFNYMFLGCSSITDIPNDLFNFGKTQIEIENIKINVYDEERMLVELIRKKNIIPFDYYKEIITNYRKKADKLDIYKIQQYISYYKNESSLYDTLMREVF